jgi:hypothetical protein
MSSSSGARLGKAHGELAPLAESFTACVHGSTVELDERFHERQPDAEPSVRAMGRTVDLHEPVENSPNHL